MISRRVKPAAANHATRCGMARRSFAILSLVLAAGCGGANAQHAKAPTDASAPPAASNGDPCHQGASSDEAHLCLDRAEALEHSGGDGAAKLAAKVCGGHLDSRDRARCFNLGVMVQ